jgi:hypothetical protein
MNYELRNMCEEVIFVGCVSFLGKADENYENISQNS